VVKILFSEPAGEQNEKKKKVVLLLFSTKFVGVGNAQLSICASG
jgi:hypothetical protein